MEVEARNYSMSLCVIYFTIVVGASHTNFKIFSHEPIYSVASDYYEKNNMKDVLAQNFRLGCLNDF